MVYRAIGLMSGTSMDGLDMACCIFVKNRSGWNFEIEAVNTCSFPEDLAGKLKEAMFMQGLDLVRLDRKLGQWMGEQVKGFISEHNLEPELIGSHGHTVFHEPDKGLTYQIGYSAEIVAATSLPVISDFRGMDVALGGQGAPLVPIGDELLFGNMDYCLNLGGIANISFQKDGQRIAFDLCAANMVLNRLAGEAGMPYDDKGKKAASGQVDYGLLKKLNSLQYFSLRPPKSLGYEWVSEHVFPLTDDQNIPLEDRMHTFCLHIGEQTGLATTKRKTGARMLCTGGGTFNDFLMTCIRKGTRVEVFKPEDTLISYKEAIVFAFLAVLRQRGEINCLPSVTGARQACSGGTISPLLSS
ncbi:anhydro-N-acetylmuramic acid kinase [Roseivirga sp. BDSF3-8]|uniref:anhydro-N-acetylmuramic acid kinase n=1 Tax=Roseivirga sp. BDSF3-8 TaxID=3241598 RepID=UPI0035325A53